MTPGLEGGAIAHPQRLERERHQVRRGTLGIIFERRQAGWRAFGEIRLARVDQPVEIGPGKPQPADRDGQRLDDVMAAHAAIGKRGGDVFTPPFEPDTAQHRLGYDLAHPCNLVVEGVKREQRLAARGRRKQRGLEPVAVVASDHRRSRRQVLRIAGTVIANGRFSTEPFST